jgi:preprotein translocase subunit SecF
MNFLNLRFIPYTISGLLIAFSIFAISFYGLPLSTEFTGGTELQFKSKSDSDFINNILVETENYELKQEGDIYVFTSSVDMNEEQVNSLRQKLQQSENFEEENLSVVKPVMGSELIYKTLVAVAISVLVIFAFIAYSFKSVVASVSAIVAMIHDTLILTGFFAFFGAASTAKVDLLFVTALLTVLSFSLYDTIVIFDKVRENYKLTSGGYYQVLDMSVKQTMVRSINNSITSMLVLFSLALFVTGPLYWFALALLIGVILGTYSSPMVAVPVFYDLNNLVLKIKKSKKPKRKKKK